MIKVFLNSEEHEVKKWVCTACFSPSKMQVYEQEKKPCSLISARTFESLTS